MTISRIEQTSWKYHLSNKQTIQILLYTSYSTSVAPWTLKVTHLILFEEYFAKFGADFCDIHMEKLIKVNKKIVKSELKGFPSDLTLKHSFWSGSENIHSQTNKLQIFKSNKHMAFCSRLVA